MKREPSAQGKAPLNKHTGDGDEDGDADDGEEYDPAAAGGAGVSSSEDDTAPLPATSPPTQNKTNTTHIVDAVTRTATRVPVSSELGNGKGKVGRAVEVPQPPPNKHSVDGDGSVAPARKKPRSAAGRARNHGRR